MASIYCCDCNQLVNPGWGYCEKCGSNRLACLQCHRNLGQGQYYCPVCDVSLVTVQVQSPASDDARSAVAQIPAAVGMVSRVQESYQGGRFGVRAEVAIPPRDAAIMNEILQLVQLLHGMAGRLNQFQGLTDHTRQVIREMRSLASLAQEEVEMRRGPT